MLSLIVEDDNVSQTTLSAYLSKFGEVVTADDGLEALAAVAMALRDGRHFDLITLDIMMPNLNGQKALAQIRELESQHNIRVGDGAKIIMTTALNDKENIFTAFNNVCEGYLIKPIMFDKLNELLVKFQLISEVDC